MGTFLLNVDTRGLTTLATAMGDIQIELPLLVEVVMFPERNTLSRLTALVTALVIATGIATGIAGAQAELPKKDKMAKMDKMEKAESKKDQAEKMPWGPGPDFLPKGAKMHVVSGNPGAAGPFVLHLMFPGGYRIKPHSHPTDEHVKVVSGTFLYGMGDTFQRKSLQVMTAGKDGNIPARMNHYAAARGQTVVEITSTGPFQITYVNAKDDPRGTKK